MIPWEQSLRAWTFVDFTIVIANAVLPTEEQELSTCGTSLLQLHKMSRTRGITRAGILSQSIYMHAQEIFR